MCLCSNFIQTFNTLFFIVSLYYLDRANFFLKLPSQTLLSNLVAVKPQTLFPHYLILKFGFQISASKFILKLCFKTSSLSFVLKIICTQSLCMLVWKHGASAQPNGKMVAGWAILVCSPSLSFSKNQMMAPPGNNITSDLFDCIGTVIPTCSMVAVQTCLAITSQTEFAATTYTFFFPFSSENTIYY